MLKFRSMRAAEESEAVVVAHVSDTAPGGVEGVDRRTRLGTFMRKTSLDELPQLFNVLRGEMSLVGPRPFVVHESQQITGWAGRRLETTPGITGLWQVSGRSDLSWDDAVRLDLYYVDNWSLVLDLHTMWRTLWVVLRRKGAY